MSSLNALATEYMPVTPTAQKVVAAEQRKESAGSQSTAVHTEKSLDSSERAVEAAVQERAQIDYDQPADSERQALGHYKAIATYAQRDEIQQMVGIDVYA